MGSNPVQGGIFLGFNFTAAEVSVYKCDDQSYLQVYRFTSDGVVVGVL